MADATANTTRDGALPLTPAQPRPLDGRKRADQVRDRIVELIREGQLPEGAKLPTEPQLVELFGVGRSSVRAAVQSLIGLGLVEMRPGRGAYVRRPSLDDVVRMVDGAIRLDYAAALQLHEARAMIEVTAARLAATRRTPEDLARMEEAIARYRDACDRNDFEAEIEADLAFHAALIEATRNDVLATMLASISGILREHRRQYLAPPLNQFRNDVIAEHVAIYDAIAAGDRVGALKSVQHHMRSIWRQIEDQVARTGDSALVCESYLPMYDEGEGG